MSHFHFDGDPFAQFGFGSSFGSGFFGRHGFGSGFGHRGFAGRQHGFPGVGQQYRYDGGPQRRARRQGPAEVVDLGGKILGEVVDEEDGRAANGSAAGPGTARNGQRYPQDRRPPPPQQEYQNTRGQFEGPKRAPEDPRRPFAQARAKTHTSGACSRGGYTYTSSVGNDHTSRNGRSATDPCEHGYRPQFTPRQQYPMATETPRQASAIYTTPLTGETPQPQTTAQSTLPRSAESQQHYRTSYYPTGRTMPSPRSQRPRTTPADPTPTPAAPPRKRKRSGTEEVIVISDDDGSAGNPKKKRRERSAGGEGLRAEMRDHILRPHRGDGEDTAQYAVPPSYENRARQAHAGH